MNVASTSVNEQAEIAATLVACLDRLDRLGLNFATSHIQHAIDLLRPDQDPFKDDPEGMRFLDNLDRERA